ncbi:MAG: cation diffusion facilitator family transporter [Planctomycetota bacterium]
MHDHAHQDHSPRAGRPLLKALIITCGTLLVEVVGGFLTGSLALLADATHMLSDAGALGLAWFASFMAARPPTLAKTYGYRRTEVLAALLNSALLLAVSILIAHEAIARWSSPPAIDWLPMMSIAGLGLAANLTSYLMLKHGATQNINTRAAMWHVLTDALGSIAAIVAGLLIALRDWRLADPIASLSISALVLGSGVSILRETLNILMEGTPSHLDLREIRHEILGLGGVRELHDLHVWTITSGFEALTCHLRVDHPEKGPEFVSVLQRRLRERFGINHATIQIEPPEDLTLLVPREK